MIWLSEASQTCSLPPKKPHLCDLKVAMTGQVHETIRTHGRSANGSNNTKVALDLKRAVIVARGLPFSRAVAFRDNP